MYKLFGFITVVFCCLEGTGQTGKVFPDSIAYWREAGIGGDIGGGEIRFTDYLIKGDTVIDSVKYMNLYENKFGYIRSNSYPSRLNPFSYYASYGLTKKIAVIRRDSLKILLKVIQPANVFSELLKDTLALKGKEYLVFDFSWQPGDTVFSEFYKPGSPNYLVIKDFFKDIKPVTGNSDSISYLTFEDKTSGGFVINFTDSNTFIRGLGFTSSFFLRFTYFDTNYVYNRHGHGAGGISEFCSDGKLIYKNPVIYGLTDSANLDCGSVNTQVFVGIKEAKQTIAVNLYPNPVKNILTISDIDESDYKIKIFSAIGQAYSINPTLNRSTVLLDVSDLPPGLYFLAIETGEKTTIARFIKQ